MSRKVIMTTNERHLQALNQMRASYRGVQLLRQDRTRFMQDGSIVQSSFSSTSDSRYPACDELSMETDESDVLKETAEAMYASTGDTIWLSFQAWQSRLNRQVFDLQFYFSNHFLGLKDST